MKSGLGAQCDDLYVSSRLSLKLNLTLERETVLHFFDRIRREHPPLRRLRRKSDGSFVLEESEADPREGGPRRWIRLEPTALRVGHFNPPTADTWRRFGATLFEYAPYFLSLSDLDIDHLEVVYGFDFEYRGNHDQLVAETLLADHPLSAVFSGDQQTPIIDCQPYIGIALTPDCNMQAYLDIKSRTSTFEVRTGEYDPQILSVYLTLRQYWGLGDEANLPQAFCSLNDAAAELAAQRVIPMVVNPLAMAIASRS